MYNHPGRPAEQKKVIEAHQRNLAKFDQNGKTFEEYLTRHTQNLANLAHMLRDMEKIIENNTLSLKFEKFTGQTAGVNWFFDWIEKNYQRLFESATKEVDKEASEASATLPHFLEFLQQRRRSSTKQVARFEKYTSREAAAQCPKNFKFEDKNNEHTDVIKEILRFTYQNNLDFYTQTHLKDKF